LTLDHAAVIRDFIARQYDLSMFNPGSPGKIMRDAVPLVG
jgi:hypothetical protein